MDNKLTGLLYRILKGRLRFSRDGLVLFIVEPSLDIIAASYELYSEQERDAYLNGLYIESEIVNTLINEDIWSPHSDKLIEDIKKEIENTKVECYNGFYDKRKLNQLKARLKRQESELFDLFNKKSSMDHLSCDGHAENVRNIFIISQTVFHENGTPYDWKNGSLDYSDLLLYYRQNSPTSSQLREIARNDPWRSMWNISKKRGGPIEGSPVNYTRDQMSLCSYSMMYDNVYEHPESPSEDIINDDDCLDGWFIVQRRKSDEDKKNKTTESVITNPRIRNAKEIFLMAPTKEAANDILDLNDPQSRAIIKQREQIMSTKGDVKDSEFTDVQIELQMKRNNLFTNKMKGGK